MHARAVLGVGKGVLFREVSSVQESILMERERGSTVFISVCLRDLSALPLSPPLGLCTHSQVMHPVPYNIHDNAGLVCNLSGLFTTSHSPIAIQLT